MTDRITISAMGDAGLLLDAAQGAFDDAIQARLHAMAATLRGTGGITETVPGMNNLMIRVAPDRLPPDRAEALLRDLCASATPQPQAGRLIEIPVIYAGRRAEDFDAWAQEAGLTADAAIAAHSGATYSVAAVGAMPGFGYLSGLDPRLARPRRKSPRASVPAGAVIIGGAQAGVMPITAPSGWHIIGMTDVPLFDPAADPPCLFAPGDRVRFTVAGIAR